MILQSMKKDLDEKRFEEETYVKLLPTYEESPQSTTADGITAGVPGDNEQLTREDLKFSVKIFLRSLEPAILTHTINTGSLPFDYSKRKEFSC